MAKRRKKKTPPKKASGGSMRNLRGGFRGMLSGGKAKKGKPDEVQFFKIAAALFVFGVVLYFASR